MNPPRAMILFAHGVLMAACASGPLGGRLAHGIPGEGALRIRRVRAGTRQGVGAHAWSGTRAGRAALALALTEMMRNGDVDRARAEEIATMVLRTNASKL